MPTSKTASTQRSFLAGFMVLTRQAEKLSPFDKCCHKLQFANADHVVPIDTSRLGQAITRSLQ